MSRICAYSTCNDAYIAQCVVSLLSVRHWNAEVDLFVVARTGTLTACSRQLLQRHAIGLVELDLTREFHTEFSYPVECYYIFSGPEVFGSKGYDFSLYIDGDVYCNGEISLPWNRIEFFAGVSHGSIEKLLGNDLDQIRQRWSVGEIVEYRVQSGVVAFNNANLNKVNFLRTIVEIYDESIRLGIPRKGDDSLFSLFQLLNPQIQPVLLEDTYNLLIRKSSQFAQDDETVIRDTVFFHFTASSPKPWLRNQAFPSFTAKYFARKWMQRMFDYLSESELERYFPENRSELTDSHMRFYWWGDRNVGDLITPYFLEHVCGVKNSSSLRIDEDQMSISTGRVARWLKSFRRKFVNRSRPHLKPRYCISTGSVMRLCSPEAVVYGSGIRSKNQPIEPGLIKFARGPLTRAQILKCGGECPPVYGDPGLLLSRYYKPERRLPSTRLVIAPHFTEFEQIRDMYLGEDQVRVVDMGCGDLLHVIEQIATADRVVSSSLHGIVIANSYQVPVRWIQFSDKIQGDNTKFHDHFASIGRPNEMAINAIEFQRLEPDILFKSVYAYELNIDLNRIQDEMFFDSNGFRNSAYYAVDS